MPKKIDVDDIRRKMGDDYTDKLLGLISKDKPKRRRRISISEQHIQEAIEALNGKRGTNLATLGLVLRAWIERSPVALANFTTWIESIRGDEGEFNTEAPRPPIEPQPEEPTTPEPEEPEATREGPARVGRSGNVASGPAPGQWPLG